MSYLKCSNACCMSINRSAHVFQFQILLTRYQGGMKRPVVMFHGAGVSSEIFSLDSIDTNLLEYLLEKG